MYGEQVQKGHLTTFFWLKNEQNHCLWCFLALSAKKVGGDLPRNVSSGLKNAWMIKIMSKQVYLIGKIHSDALFDFF